MGKRLPEALRLCTESLSRGFTLGLESGLLNADAVPGCSVARELLTLEAHVRVTVFIIKIQLLQARRNALKETGVLEALEEHVIR